MKIWGRPPSVVARWSPPRADHDAVYIQVRAAARGRRTAVDLATEQQRQTGGEIESITLGSEEAVRVWNAQKGIAAVGVTRGEMQYLITCAHAPNDRKILDDFCASWRFTEVAPLSRNTQLDPQRLRVNDRFTIQFPPWMRWAREAKTKAQVVGSFVNASIVEMPASSPSPLQGEGRGEGRSDRTATEMFAMVVYMPDDLQGLSEKEFIKAGQLMLVTMSATNTPVTFRPVGNFKDRRISNPAPAEHKDNMRWQGALISLGSGTRVMLFFNYQCDGDEAQAALAKLVEDITASIKPVSAKPAKR